MKVGIDPRVGENGLDFRPEQKALGAETIIKWLDAQPIAGDEQALLPRVPNSEGKHAPQMVDAVLSVLFIEVNDGFGVTVGAIPMAACNQLLAQSQVVVDFTVECDPERTILVAEWLVSGRKVDDAEAAHAEANPALGVDSFVVGAAMHHGRAHPPQDL